MPHYKLLVPFIYKKVFLKKCTFCPKYVNIHMAYILSRQ